MCCLAPERHYTAQDPRLTSPEVLVVSGLLCQWSLPDTQI